LNRHFKIIEAFTSSIFSFPSILAAHGQQFGIGQNLP
jgi:hypothetical protein